MMVTMHQQGCLQIVGQLIQHREAMPMAAGRFVGHQNVSSLLAKVGQHVGPDSAGSRALRQRLAAFAESRRIQKLWLFGRIPDAPLEGTSQPNYRV